MDISLFSNPSSVEEYLAFLVLVIMHRATINILVYRFSVNVNFNFSRANQGMGLLVSVQFIKCLIIYKKL